MATLVYTHNAELPPTAIISGHTYNEPGNLGPDWGRQRYQNNLPNTLIAIDELRELDDDWDDCGSPRISDEVISNATSVARHLDLYCRNKEIFLPAGVVSPLPDGGIRIDWIGNNISVGIVINPNVNSAKLIWRRPDSIKSLSTGLIEFFIARSAITILWDELYKSNN